MTDEPHHTPPPKHIDAVASELVRAWQMLAHNAGEIAAARRTLYLAYVSEGFTEAQALELVKTP